MVPGLVNLVRSANGSGLSKIGPSAPTAGSFGAALRDKVGMEETQGIDWQRNKEANASLLESTPWTKPFMVIAIKGYLCGTGGR